MDLRVIILLLLLSTQCALGMFLPNSKRDFRKKPETKYADLLHDLAVIKLKLETMGFGPVYIEGPFDNGRPMAKSLQDAAPVPHSPTEDAPSPFNELEILELIPVIIEQKRQGNVSPDEEKTLKEIFGDLWIVIEEEVNRVAGEEMNPILTALLQSHESRLKRALVQQKQPVKRPHWKLEQPRRKKQLQPESSAGLGLEAEEQNDIFGNTVDRVRVTRFPKAFLEVNTAELSPQERLMRHAALLIRQWLDEDTAGQRNLRRGRAGGAPRAKKGGNKKRGMLRLRGNRRGRNNNNNSRRAGSAAGQRRSRSHVRPKRHNTDIYVDDNHAPYDYEDFEDYFAIDDSMTKPRAMRSSSRTFFNEYDSLEDEDDEEQDAKLVEEDY